MQKPRFCLRQLLRPACATLRAAVFYLRHSYARLARPYAHQCFQRPVAEPCAGACAVLTPPSARQVFPATLVARLTHSLGQACAALAPQGRLRKNAYAMLARSLRRLPPTMFSVFRRKTMLTREFRTTPKKAMLTPCFREACAALRQTFWRFFFDAGHIYLFIF